MADARRKNLSVSSKSHSALVKRAANVAGETDQDWGEGRAPFPEDNLPDGGSGGAARVVPGHSGKDWAAEMGNRDVRMKADRGKTTATTEAVSSHPGEKGHCSQKWRRNNLPRREQPMADWKNDLQIYEAGQK